CVSVSPPLLVGSITGQDGILMSAGQYAYDAVSEQIRFNDYGTYKNRTFSFDFLMQFKQGIVYEIDSTRSTCKKFAMKSSFHPMRIPTNAKFLSEIILGTTSIPQMGLQITTWEGEDAETKGRNAGYKELVCHTSEQTVQSCMYSFSGLMHIKATHCCIFFIWVHFLTVRCGGHCSYRWSSLMMFHFERPFNHRFVMDELHTIKK
uniref:Uncharacterized protein n=1 Tax=Pygocentrus nattereri TaxID=42514 RepID=A0AAR2JNF0_PYGNA